MASEPGGTEGRMAEQHDDQQPQPDWLNQRLRVMLLPENPHFEGRVRELRLELGVPEAGFPGRQAALDWVHGHLTEHKPYLLPHDGEPDARAMAHRRELARHWLGQEIERFGGGLPLIENVKRLLGSFSLPRVVFGHLVWHVVNAGPVPVPSAMVIEEVGPPTGDFLEDEIEYEAYRAGLPEEAGDLVVMRLIVTEHTTKRESVDVAWEFIKDVRSRRLGGRPAPRRRRAGLQVEQDQLPEWLTWYQARHAGLTLERVAAEFDRDVGTIRYGIEQLDALMRPSGRENRNP